MQKISAIYKQHVPSAHPDLLIEVQFRYTATVDKDEEVTVESVQLLDGTPQPNLRITGEDEGMRRFRAVIRDHARETAYKIRKENGHA